MASFIGSNSGTPIKGTNTNDSASAGNVGETISATASGTTVPASGAYGDLTSVSLTAGDWLVTGCFDFNSGGAGTSTSASIGVSTTSGNSGTGLNAGDNLFSDSRTLAASSGDVSLYVPAYRISLASTTIVYLKIRINYTSTAGTASGRLSAVRIR